MRHPIRHGRETAKPLSACKCASDTRTQCLIRISVIFKVLEELNRKKKKNEKLVVLTRNQESAKYSPWNSLNLRHMPAR